MEKVLQMFTLVCRLAGQRINKAVLIALLASPFFLQSVYGQCNLALIVSTTPADCGVSNGKAKVEIVAGTGFFPFTWSWSNGATVQNPTGLAAGYYTCTVTDLLGCTKTVEVLVQSNLTITGNTNITNITCPGGNSGSISLVGVHGDSGPYTYSWSPGGATTSTINGLTAGTYVCRITSGNGCIGVKTAVVTEPAQIVPIVAIENVSCTGTADGSAQVTVSGGTSPYTYSWAPGGSTATMISNLSEGTYTCTVTDAKGCIKTASINITKPVPFTSSAVFTNVTCKGGNDGSASIVVNGGTGPFIYAWSPVGGSEATATNLKEGTYFVEIADANNCSSVNLIKISAFSNISVTEAITPADCGGPNIGSIKLTPSGGITPYTYKWTGSASTSSNRVNLAAGSYEYTITDNFDCKYTATAIVGAETCTDIIPKADAKELIIYPNPARDHIKIESPFAISKLRLLDPNGKLILETEGENEMNLPVLDKGMYYIQLYTAEGSIVKKLSIE